LAEVKEYADDLDSTSYLTDASISLWPMCVGRRTSKMTINGSYLFGEVIKPNVNCTVEVEVRLCDIPEAVHLQGKTFILRGLVGFVGGKKSRLLVITWRCAVEETATGSCSTICATL
jgi:hypothetical protein